MHNIFLGFAVWAGFNYFHEEQETHGGAEVTVDAGKAHTHLQHEQQAHAEVLKAEGTIFIL